VPGLDDPVKAEVSGGRAFDIDAEVDLTWEPDACRILPRESGGR
jgi:hypothetical protein